MSEEVAHEQDTATAQFLQETSNRSGLFEIFDDNSPRDEIVPIRFPKGQIVCFRNYANLQARREIQAEAKEQSELLVEQSRQPGPFAKYSKLDRADFSAAVVLRRLCVDETEVTDWLDSALRNPTLFAWLILQVDLAFFGLLKAEEMEVLDAAKKE